MDFRFSRWSDPDSCPEWRNVKESVCFLWCPPGHSPGSDPLPGLHKWLCWLHNTAHLDSLLMTASYTEKLKVYMMLSFSNLTWRLLVDGNRIGWCPVQFCYKSHNHILEKVKSSKYLGFTIQNILKWDQHINVVLYF